MPADKIRPDNRHTWPTFTPRDRELIELFLAQLMVDSQNGLESAKAMYVASQNDPALIKQIEHFETYMKAFRWAILRASHRQACLAQRILSGTPYPE